MKYLIHILRLHRQICFQNLTCVLKTVACRKWNQYSNSYRRQCTTVYATSGQAKLAKKAILDRPSLSQRRSHFSFSICPFSLGLIPRTRRFYLGKCIYYLQLMYIVFNSYVFIKNLYFVKLLSIVIYLSEVCALHQLVTHSHEEWHILYRSILKRNTQLKTKAS